MNDTGLLRFKFDGGLASQGQLDFYEASRFQYGAARFLYTVEIYRQTGRISRRVTEGVKVDLRVSTAEKGSFIQDIVVAAAPIVSSGEVFAPLSKVPLKVVASYFLDKLFPKKAAKDTAVEIAKEFTKQQQQRSEQERQRTLQSKEETERLKTVATAVSGGGASTNQMLEIIKAQSDGLIAANTASQEVTRGLMKELEAMRNREALIERHGEAFLHLDDESVEKLTNHLASSFRDIFLPVRKSADTVSLTDSGGAGRILYADDRTVSSLYGEVPDSVPTELRGKIVGYNIETGHGTFRNDWLVDKLSFRVPGHQKNEYRHEILEAMKYDQVSASFYLVKDARGRIIRLIFDKLIQ